jgi:hypothetical protein
VAAFDTRRPDRSAFSTGLQPSHTNFESKVGVAVVRPGLFAVYPVLARSGLASWWVVLAVADEQVRVVMHDVRE